MVFSSIEFLFYFLPLVMILYFVFPNKARNFILLVFSLFFYFYGEGIYTLLMLAAILSAFVNGLLIEKYRGRRLSKLFLIFSVVINAGMLIFFKYANFTVENINSLFGASLATLKIALPIGISFYTFQTLSYTVDVYRGEVKAQKNIIDLATYVSLFPQLIAGPIVRYSDIVPYLKGRKLSLENFAMGMRRFILGLSKKVLIANVLGELCNIFKETNERSALFFWLYAVSFALHLYFDFSGYSDMAIGLGKIFGFEFMENFNYPYISKSITEFWRRWHISLGTWFRDYIYIPLGGSRVSKIKWLRNILIVWLFTGLWHGAGWNFIVWGLYFAFFLLLEKFALNKIKIPKVLSHIYVIITVLISFVIFNADNLATAINDIGGLFSVGCPLVNSLSLYYLRSYAVPLIIAMIGATPLPKLILEKINKKVLNILEPAVLLILLVAVTAFLADGSFNPFLYFRF